MVFLDILSSNSVMRGSAWIATLDTLASSSLLMQSMNDFQIKGKKTFSNEKR